ncbi:hypothetical protein BpHYR1_051198 [Brachionus plicatilis]|uniref:Uncharacterized protein n=1 Tax=Brachionus plicatilis TaxID=10195 RepID=A0A3M7S4S5_BRAPC|nr:hypothetical protein BpHYR1_051198 [Brachionus plicatilis]
MCLVFVREQYERTCNVDDKKKAKEKKIRKKSLPHLNIVSKFLISLENSESNVSLISPGFNNIYCYKENRTLLKRCHPTFLIITLTYIKKIHDFDLNLRLKNNKRQIILSIFPLGYFVKFRCKFTYGKLKKWYLSLNEIMVAE